MKEYLSRHLHRKLQNSTKRTHFGILSTTFYDNPCTTIVTCNNPTKATDESDIPTFYKGQPSLARHIPRHNVLISEDVNVKIGNYKDHKFCSHNLPNSDVEYLVDFQQITFFDAQIIIAKKEGKLWTNTYSNNVKAQLDYIFTNKNWIDSTENCEAYSSFEGVSSDHRFLAAKISLSIRMNNNQNHML